MKQFKCVPAAMMAVVLITTGLSALLGNDGLPPDTLVAKDTSQPQGSKRKTTAARVVADIFKRTNAFRKEEGKYPLNLNPKLSEAAQKHAEKMAVEGKMAHELDGVGPSGRIKAAGYKAQATEENVATEKGHGDPAATAVEAWKKSPGHRKNMLSTGVTEIGVGAAQGKSGKWYFCQDFAKPRK